MLSVSQERLQKFPLPNGCEIQYRRCCSQDGDEHIGSGLFGDIVKGYLYPPITTPQPARTHRRIPSSGGAMNETRKQIAVKLFELSSKSDDAKTAIKSYINEVEAMQKLRHRNIVRLLAFYPPIDHVYREQHFFIAMEYASRGSLETLLNSSTKMWYELAHAVSWGLQVSAALEYMHNTLNMAHRDLKPANMLVFDDEGQCDVIKLCDFGLSRNLATVTWNAGTPEYMAPECFDRQRSTSPERQGNISPHQAADLRPSPSEADGKRNYSQPNPLASAVAKASERRKPLNKMDVYSWSICFWRMLTRQEPYESSGDEDVIGVGWLAMQGRRPSTIHNCPPAIMNLLQRCWSTSPDDRPPIEDVHKCMKLFYKLGYPVTLYKDCDLFSPPKPPLARPTIQCSAEICNLSNQLREEILRRTEEYHDNVVQLVSLEEKFKELQTASSTLEDQLKLMNEN